MSAHETIAAISTPIGPGGIGIVRLSGPEALGVAGKLAALKSGDLKSRPSHTTSLARIINPASGDVVDQVLITIMKAPNSYTREDVVEINCHSGAPTLRTVLNLVLAAGARMAEPGEFTKRAFLSGRIDLTQAQAVISLIQARSDAAARAAASQADGQVASRIDTYRQELIGIAAELEAAIDFTDADIDPLDAGEICRKLEVISEQVAGSIKQVAQGRVLDRGLITAIVGRPNVGKSSLLNALAMEDRAIVSAQPGTTRDIVESQVVLGDIPLHIKDTAGWRPPGDDIEAQGIHKARQAMESADIVLLVLDGSEPIKLEDQELIKEIMTDKPLVTAINKSDLIQKLAMDNLPPMVSSNPVVRLSAKCGEGLDELGDAVAGRIGLITDLEGSEVIMASARQEQDLIRAKAKLSEALAADAGRYGEEIISDLVKEAIAYLGRFCGDDVNEEVLAEVFSRFCIGK